ncbi:hypothetical protein L3X38_000681 [Prunus dulcis]|uniref:Transmembrane protein n=1 Tax=Prunus dulcis TaxID=3755 RepID=A0AAD4WS57_PRUDU|nr:hypothetical protein L3X38_000681 [Prunus dulcis]
MGDHPRKLLVSSQKQNRAGSEGGPKRTISCYGRAGLECDNFAGSVWLGVGSFVVLLLFWIYFVWGLPLCFGGLGGFPCGGRTAMSRHLPFTTIFSASTTRGSPLLGDCYAIGVAFKVLMSLIAWIMVALFVALVACPPPFSISSIGYWFLFGGCGLVLIMLLFGYGWCGISLFCFHCFLCALCFSWLYVLFKFYDVVGIMPSCVAVSSNSFVEFTLL